MRFGDVEDLRGLSIRYAVPSVFHFCCNRIIASSSAMLFSHLFYLILI